MKVRHWIPSMLFVLGMAGCSSTGMKLDGANHLSVDSPKAPTTSGSLPEPVTHSYYIPPATPRSKAAVYSVVVNNVKAQDILFALARDAKINIDIHPGISGTVTLNALDQTLPQLLERISKQIDMRYEFDGKNLSVLPDLPFLINYKVDYVNLTRDTTSVVSVSSQIGSGATTNSSQPAAIASGSGSTAKVESSSKNRIWETLVQNTKDLLRETDKVLPASVQAKPVETSSLTKQAASSNAKAKPSVSESVTLFPDEKGSVSEAVREFSFREAASVIANPETGLLSIRATSRQHQKIKEFLGKVMDSAKRQVLIEATIAEVHLTRNYQQGIDWKALNIFDTGFRIIQSATGQISGPSSTLLEMGYNSSGGNFSSTVRLLEEFGEVKVLSSPKLSVLNNQTAVMKVVDDNIYFTYEIDEREATQYAAGKTTVKSTMHSVPVGLVLTVTPQIGDDQFVTLNIRPSLSRVIGQKIDPSIQLAVSNSNITNTIPIIRAREFDSVMRINNGNIAVMGGLMEDLLNNEDDTVPGLGKLPVFGPLFQNRNDSKSKTELVIFIRPTVIQNTDIAGDFSSSRSKLPDRKFFESSLQMPASETTGAAQ
jgi:MSHA type pilus biogenesis protein MshL